MIVWGINTKFSPVDNLNRYPFCNKKKDLGALDLDFLPKTSKTFNGHIKPSFEATTSKSGENSFFAKLQICWYFGWLASKSLKSVKSVITLKQVFDHRQPLGALLVQVQLFRGHSKTKQTRRGRWVFSQIFMSLR